MTIRQIKAIAREKIKGNKFKILYPFLLILTISLVATFLAKRQEGVQGIIISLATTVTVAGFSGAYFAYILKFIRTGEANFLDIISCFLSRWQQIIWSGFLAKLYTLLWSLLFVIPGIHAFLSYSMVTYLAIDTNLNSKSVIAQSKQLMRGHKIEFFILVLSFLGWILLTPFTLFILCIWLLPYMWVSIALYYDQLINGGTLTEMNFLDQEENQDDVVTE